MRRWLRRRRTPDEAAAAREGKREAKREPGTGTAEPRGHRTAGDGVHYAGRAGGLSHVQVVLFPIDRTGPAPLHIPVTGHNVYIDLAANGTADVVLHGFRAEVLGRGPLKPDGVSLVPQPWPALVLGDEPAEARRRGPEHYEPMLTPDVEVFLDEDPPLVRTALNARGSPAWPEFRLPLRLGAGSQARVVVAPHTEDRGLVDWRLTADVTCGGLRATARWDFRVTAETTFRSFRSDGSQAFAPVHDVAPHWQPAWPACRPPASAPGAPGGPGSRSGDPREAGYLLARRGADYVQCVRRLLGMDVWLPLRGTEREYFVTYRGGNGLVRAYTSVERAGRLVRPEGGPAPVQVRRFAKLVAGWRHPGAGLVINPNTASEFQIPRRLFPEVMQIQAELNGPAAQDG